MNTASCDPGPQAARVMATGPIISRDPSTVYRPLPWLQSAWTVSCPPGSSVMVYLLGSVAVTVVPSPYSVRSQRHVPWIGAAGVGPPADGVDGCCPDDGGPPGICAGARGGCDSWPALARLAGNASIGVRRQTHSLRRRRRDMSLAWGTSCR